jgi:hypothetical protein
MVDGTSVYFGARFFMVVSCETDYRVDDWFSQQKQMEDMFMKFSWSLVLVFVVAYMLGVYFPNVGNTIKSKL